MSAADLLEELRLAMLSEQTGIEFYTTAARTTTDPRGREVFLILAAEESLHLRFLKDHYGAVSAGREPEPIVAMAHGAELNAESPIFSEELRRRIATAHFEMSALAVGLKLEHETISRYRTLAAIAPTPAAKQFFEQLVEWEQSHASALSRQQAQLLDQYWQAARFAPF